LIETMTHPRERRMGGERPRDRQNER
jgi:hypothetical protein